MIVLHELRITQRDSIVGVDKAELSGSLDFKVRNRLAQERNVLPPVSVGVLDQRLFINRKRNFYRTLTVHSGTRPFQVFVEIVRDSKVVHLSDGCGKRYPSDTRIDKKLIKSPIVGLGSTNDPSIINAGVAPNILDGTLVRLGGSLFPILGASCLKIIIKRRVDINGLLHINLRLQEKSIHGALINNRGTLPARIYMASQLTGTKHIVSCYRLLPSLR
jgi:hypothetical protein